MTISSWSTTAPTRRESRTRARGSPTSCACRAERTATRVGATRLERSEEALTRLHSSGMDAGTDRGELADSRYSSGLLPASGQVGRLRRLRATLFSGPGAGFGLRPFHP